MAVETAGELQDHEAIGVLYRQAAEQSLIEQAEDGGIRADTECERDDCDRGKSGRLAQLALRYE